MSLTVQWGESPWGCSQTDLHVEKTYLKQELIQNSNNCVKQDEEGMKNDMVIATAFFPCWYKYILYLPCLYIRCTTGALVQHCFQYYVASVIQHMQKVNSSSHRLMTLWSNNSFFHSSDIIVSPVYLELRLSWKQLCTDIQCAVGWCYISLIIQYNKARLTKTSKNGLEQRLFVCFF